jgi:hypothetical protein
MIEQRDNLLEGTTELRKALQSAIDRVDAVEKEIKRLL